MKVLRNEKREGPIQMEIRTEDYYLERENHLAPYGHRSDTRLDDSIYIYIFFFKFSNFDKKRSPKSAF